MTWRITVIVIFASNILSFFSTSSQPALKTWKSSSWVTQEKHGLVARLSAASKIESLASYNPQSPSGDWQLIEWQWDLNLSPSIIFYPLCSLYVLEPMSCLKEKWLNAKGAVVATASDFEISSISCTPSHIHNTQRSVRSGSSLWRCFWHGSALHAP